MGARWFTIGGAGVTGAALLFTAFARAQCDLGRLEPTFGTEGGAFGWSIAADDGCAIVGAYYETGATMGSGSAYIYRRRDDAWKAEAFLPGDSFGDYFGTSVTIDGDRALVGAIGVPHDDSTGSVYVYEHDNGAWARKARIDPEPQDAITHFGHSLALRNDVAVIGAFSDDHNIFSGSAYAYRFIAGQWTRETQLVASGDPGAMLGLSLAFDGTRALVGARLPGLTEAGVAYLFERSSGAWTQTARFNPPLGNYIGFARSVALDGDLIAIGADKDHFTGHSSGSVYMFERSQRDQWIPCGQLGPSDSQPYSHFGYSLALQGGRVLVGAAQADGPEMVNIGHAYLFDRDEHGNWVLTAKLSSAQPVESERLGYSVALTGDHALVSAVGSMVGGISTGAVNCFSTSGVVDVDDLLFVITNWGEAGGWGPADIAPPGGDGIVNTDDLLALIESWGACQ